MPVARVLVAFALVTLASCSAPRAARAQAPADTAATASSRLRLFVDSPDASLDFDFLRRELPWVDWVRDRADAEVRVLFTIRRTSSGGDEGTFFVERVRGGPAADTLRVYSTATDSDDAKRRIVARTLAALLARDLAERAEAPRLEVRVTPSTGAIATSPPHDPWDHWVYKLGTNGYVNGEATYRDAYLHGSLTASRVTERHKLGAALSQNYSTSRFDLGDGEILKTYTRSWTLRGLYTRALSPRWSAGTSAQWSSSSFSNIHSSWGVGPAVEFDVFPYAQSSSRSLTLGAQVHASHTRYEELTLYGETAETLLRSEFDVSLALRKGWGSLDWSCSANHYLHDTSKYRLTTYVNANLKLWRGLSVEGYVWAARIHDQLALRRGDTSDTEVITRQHQQATSYQYNGSFGISYRFGSIFDNVVNNRLENTLGGSDHGLDGLVRGAAGAPRIGPAFGQPRPHRSLTRVLAGSSDRLLAGQ